MVDMMGRDTVSSVVLPMSVVCMYFYEVWTCINPPPPTPTRVRIVLYAISFVVSRKILYQQIRSLL